MNNHDNAAKDCPFCLLLAGHESDLNNAEDIVYKDESVTAFISPAWYPRNPGHVLVIPNAHYPDIYTIPDPLLAQIYGATKRISMAVRHTYKGCEGITIRQNNEPAGGQHVFHLHVHIFARSAGDGLYESSARQSYVSEADRLPYARLIQRYLSNQYTPIVS